MDAWLINSGDLRNLITIYNPPSGFDEIGQEFCSTPSMEGWGVVCQRRAKIEPNVGAPYVQNDSIRNITSHRITVRHVNLTPRQRIKFGDRIFNVLGVINVEERNVQTTVAVQEVI
jgi:head-tail adaptor